MPGSTNFLQWNPTQENQESDAAYNADASRTGGAGVNGVFPSATANKLFFQCTTFITALANALAQKGYSTSDANLATLQGVLANLLTSADINGSLINVAYAPSISYPCASTNGFQTTLTGNVTSSSFAGATVGQEITLVLKQDGTGGRTFAWPSNVVNPGTPDPTPNAYSIQKFKVLLDGTIHPLGPMTVS